MRIGISLPGAIPNVESSTLVRWAVRAEQRAFDSRGSIGVVDRVCYDNHDPLTVLAAATAVTERVELLTDILIAPLRNTVLLAKQAATLDRLSRGG
jgi:alkanesulfonate monooxygenase SsuD/methylene tetrahydromethanopterin reductase-like flavin-dependent oxidoreductase (luciferase family)